MHRPPQRFPPVNCRGQARNHFLGRRSDPETNRADPVAIKRRGPTMLTTILNAIYREFLRASISGAKAAGA
jgi:hypothetical protein